MKHPFVQHHWKMIAGVVFRFDRVVTTGILPDIVLYRSRAEVSHGASHSITQ